MKQNKIKYQNEEEMEVKNFIIILVVVLVFVGVVYFFSKTFIEQYPSLYEITYTDGSYNEDMVIVGTMLNRLETEYYVIAYDNSGNYASYYSVLINKYKSDQVDPVRVYYLDTNNILNESVIATEENPVNLKARTVDDLYIDGLTLIHVKNNKIIDVITDEETILSMIEVTEEVEES